MDQSEIWNAVSLPMDWYTQESSIAKSEQIATNIIDGSSLCTDSPETGERELRWLKKITDSCTWFLTDSDDEKLSWMAPHEVTFMQMSLTLDWDANQPQFGMHYAYA